MKVSGNQHTYKIMHFLGKGKYGRVYSALDENGQLVALKFIRRERFDFREIQAYKNVASCTPHIICYYDDFPYQSGHILVTEMFPGLTIADFLRTYGSEINSKIRLKIMWNLAKNVRFLHSLGMAHRDLKPANMMIDPKTLQTKIIDLGMTCPNSLCDRRMRGTPGYIAPETQKAGVQHDFLRADIYSLGKIFSKISNGNFSLLVKQMTQDNPQRRLDISQVLQQIKNIWHRV